MAFAARGAFSPSGQNALRALLNKDLPARLAQARAHPGAARFASARSLWRLLQEGSPFPPARPGALVANVSTVRVAPFLPTLWDQQTIADAGVVACYNYFTPPYAAGSGSNYPCGCVATAMSQLMYYFQYPALGVGTNSFGIGINGAPAFASLRGGDGAGGPYLWSDMPPVPQNANAAQCQAIGALTYDAGVSVNMAYAANGSDSTLLGRATPWPLRFFIPTSSSAARTIPSFRFPPLWQTWSILIWTLAGRSCSASRPSEGALRRLRRLRLHRPHALPSSQPGVLRHRQRLVRLARHRHGGRALAYTNISSCIYNVCASGGGDTSADESSMASAILSPTRPSPRCAQVAACTRRPATPMAFTLW